MQVELIIPVLDNDGSDNSAIIKAQTIALVKLYGGATTYDAKGAWVCSEGVLYEDDVKVLVSATTDKANAKEQMRKLAREVLETTDQLAVYFKAGDDAEIVE